MKRVVSLSLATVLFLTAGSAPDNLRARMPASQEIPKAATVKVILKTPGINDEGSRWEIAYEFRIANEITLWEAWKQRKSNGGPEQRVGELIKEGVFRESLRSPENRQAVFQIPLSPEIQGRLRNQPRERFQTTPGKITPEEIKLLKEQEIKSQNFLFYSTLNIYDAKLKRNFIIPASRTWRFEDNPDAQFEIKVEVHDDGSYSVTSPPSTKKPAN